MHPYEVSPNTLFVSTTWIMTQKLLLVKLRLCLPRNQTIPTLQKDFLCQWDAWYATRLPKYTFTHPSLTNPESLFWQNKYASISSRLQITHFEFINFYTNFYLCQAVINTSDWKWFWNNGQVETCPTIKVSNYQLSKGFTTPLAVTFT